jgi:cytoskeletal protein CcmA (bactofilin family)
MFSNKTSKASPIDSLIGAGTVIEGNISFSGGLRVDGTIKGAVKAIGNKPASLVLSETGRIEGEVEVAHVVLNGSIVGPVNASEFLELLPKAKVTGDVTYKAIEIHVGAIIMGQLNHNGRQGGTVVEFAQAKAE